MASKDAPGPFTVLADVSHVLSGPLDYAATLTAVARVALPYFGSRCVVTGGVGSDLYRDGSEIQRVVSGPHGRMRHRQGWSESQLDREATIVAEEIEALIARHVPEGMGDVRAAIAVIRHLLEQARAASTQAYRQASQGGA